MGRIQREWLERIPDYVLVEQERPRWRRSDSGEPAAVDGDTDGEAQDAATGDAQPLNDEAHGDGAPAGTHEAGDPPGEEPADETHGNQTHGADTQGKPGEGAEAEADLRLDIPDEIEQRRREDQEKRQRTGLNRGLAPQAFSLEGHFLRNLATRFARMISKVAEDSAELPSEGDEDWDLVELLKRRFTGRLISQCRMTREKRRVAVVLDTSPSCEHQARLFGSIARIAEKLGDCELYDAPNFAIMARKTGAEWETLPETEREWRFKGRVVLAFGDFDGIERICQASAVRGNKIYWFCCEERPSVLESNRDYFVKHYKSHYHPATNLHQLMRALRRVR